MVVDPLAVAALLEACRLRDSANVFHAESMLKVDLFFAHDRPFARQEMARSRKTPLSSDPVLFANVASPEDTVLRKLEWYREGGAVSERQWNDVLGMIKVQGSALDRLYLASWAEEIGVADLLDLALRESGMDSLA